MNHTSTFFTGEKWWRDGSTWFRNFFHIKYRRDGSGWIRSSVTFIREIKWWRDPWLRHEWHFDPTWLRQKYGPWVRAIPTIKLRKDIFPVGYKPWIFDPTDPGCLRDTYPIPFIRTGA